MQYAAGTRPWTVSHAGYLNRKTALTAEAPILRDVNIAYDAVRFNGSLLRENIYRKAAGPQVDAAWEALGVDCRHNLDVFYRARLKWFLKIRSEHNR